MADGPSNAKIRSEVRDHYAAAARGESCCGSERGPEAGIGASCYRPGVLGDIPAEAATASLGCANPVALAELAEGEVVLDLGSGGGIDVLLSARRVGPNGMAYGLDMTDEMLELARENQARAGLGNVEFLKGDIEDVPLPNEHVDVVLSNCVINLSSDKAAVFAEAARVLRPGGRLALADVVAEQEPTPEQRSDLSAWVACLAGAMTRDQYRTTLAEAGFVGVTIIDSHDLEDGFTSVLVQGIKPATQPE
ncbi:MAG: arsenite methyltransferase [Actinomycetota bacterium]|nr:arsenite methyltransferase [Actinomycetota bacterium]